MMKRREKEEEGAKRKECGDDERQGQGKMTGENGTSLPFGVTLCLRWTRERQNLMPRCFYAFGDTWIGGVRTVQRPLIDCLLGALVVS